MIDRLNDRDLGDDANPYAPFDFQHGEAVAEIPESPSTWIRNCKALAAVTICYLLLNVPFAITQRVMPEVLMTVLITFAAVGSAWANVPLGQRIGWDRGGLPVVLILFFAAVIAYCSVALAVGCMLYVSVGQITIYTP